MKTTQALAISLSLLGVLAAAPVAALDGQQLYMTKTCFACHGKDANTPIMPN